MWLLTRGGKKCCQISALIVPAYYVVVFDQQKRQACMQVIDKYIIKIRQKLALLKNNQAGIL